MGHLALRVLSLRYVPLCPRNSTSLAIIGSNTFHHPLLGTEHYVDYLAQEPERVGESHRGYRR